MAATQDVLEAGLQSLLIGPNSTTFNGKQEEVLDMTPYSHEDSTLALPSEVTTASTPLHSASSPVISPLVKLPHEILGHVCNYLTNAEIKKLRLTCKALAVASELRIDRVFISADKKVLEVFYGIANTPKLAARIEEIVWDDSVMMEYDGKKGRDFDAYIRDSFDIMVAEYDTREEYFRDYEAMYGKLPVPWHIEHIYSDDLWNAFIEDRSGLSAEDFEAARKSEAELLRLYREQSALKLSAEERAWIYRSEQESFQAYQNMYAEHLIILRDGEDYTALRHGLRSFPKLRGVHIEECLWNDRLDESPLMRLLPYGMLWPSRRIRSESLNGFRFQHIEWSSYVYLESDENHIWRSVDAVLSELAHCPESKVDRLTTSVGNELFMPRRRNYTDAVQVFSKLRYLNLRLDLDECSREIQKDFSLSFNNHLLQTALAGACKLEHFKFQLGQGSIQDTSSFPGFCIGRAMPLKVTDKPVWPRLQILELCGLDLPDEFLVTLFSLIQPTIKSIILRDCYVPNKPSTYCGFLERLRSDLKFKAHKPNLIIELIVWMQGDRKTLRLEEDIAEFFDGGQNPFEEPGDGAWNVFVKEGFGIITSDYDRTPLFSNYPNRDDWPLYWRGRDWVDSMRPADELIIELEEEEEEEEDVGRDDGDEEDEGEVT